MRWAACRQAGSCCHRGTCPSRSCRWPLALMGSALRPQAEPHVLPEIWKQGLPLLQDASGQLKSIFRVIGEQGSKHSHSQAPMQRPATLLCLRIIPHSLSQPHSSLIDLGLGTRALGFCKPVQLVGTGSRLRIACLESLVYCMTCSKPHSEVLQPL